MATKRVLTDRTIKSLKPAKSGQRYDLRDALVPGLAVRVTDTGQKTFVLVARYPGSSNPTRRAIEDVGAIDLAQAREKAREWLKQIAVGTDPKIAQVRERRAAQIAVGNTFEAVAERFITRQLPTQRRGQVVERVLRGQVLPHWKGRPIGDLTHRDIRELVDRVVERGALAYARNVFDAVRAVFSFAVDRGIIEVSPCALLKPAKIIGAKAIRTRVLDDGELRVVWAAAGELGYPFGSLVQMLMLTGCRLNEVAGARRPEFDGRIWTIPAERFKSGAQHVVPLTDEMVALLEGLPRFRRGDHLFSATFGEKGVTGFSKAKARINKRVGAIPTWTYHDIRRTVRTRLSELRVPEHVAELAIGHARRGLARIYDQHRFQDEIREALTLWGARLRSIIEPAVATNVVELKASVR